jgi:GT2 family glycosyltransferase
MQRNIGFRESSGDIIFYFDDDVVLEKNFISAVARVFESDAGSEIGGVAGLIVGKDEKMQKTIKWKIDHYMRKLFFLEHSCGDGRFRLSGFPATITSMTQPVTVESLPGGLTAYRRKVLEEFKFDEHLDGYCFMEDDDFSYRVSRKYKCMRTPFARLYHNSAQTNRKGGTLKKMLICNHYYLFRKNLPQTAKHKVAFWISVAGCVLKEIMSINPSGVMGLYNGLKDILNGTIDNKLTVEK